MEGLVYGLFSINKLISAHARGVCVFKGQLCDVGSLLPPFLEFGDLTLVAWLAGQALYPLRLFSSPRAF